MEEDRKEVTVFSQHIGHLAQHITSLSQSLNGSGAISPDLLSLTVEELSTYLEELLVADEELRQQNEELISARQSLEYERQRYQSLFEFAPDGYLVTDLYGKIIEANHRAGVFFAISPEKLIGKLLVGFITEKDRQIFRRNLAKLHLDIVKGEKRGSRSEWELGMHNRRGELFDAAITTAIAQEHGKTLLRWLIRDITLSKQLEQDHRDLLRLQMNTLEEERQRLSRELHDQVGQKVAAITLGLKNLENRLVDSPELTEILKQVKGQISELGQEIHQAAYDLRPASIDDLGLRAALEQYVEEWSERHPIRLNFEASTLQDQFLNTQTAIAIYRVVQEALRNIAQHSGASQASVILEQQIETIQVIVEDNGIGSTAIEQVSRSNGGLHLGILGMKERVEQFGGSFTIESPPGRGTTIFVRFPLEKNSAIQTRPSMPADQYLFSTSEAG